MAASSLVAVPLTLLCGRISDLRGRRKPLLGIAGGGMTIGLVAMAFAPSWREAAAGYCVFVTGYSIFIALHAAFTMQLLPSPAHRGRDLGLFNLTNTLPNAAGPLLALLLIDESSAFVTLWLTAALLCTVGTGLVLLVRGQR